MNDDRQYVVRWDGSLWYKFSNYMVASFLYYQMNRSVISDHDFDRLCREIDAGWDDFEHEHKHLVDRGQLSATTGFAIKYYPLRVRSAASDMLARFHER